jgi:hypothetical protein
VNCCRGMINQAHHFTFLKPGPRAAGDESDAQAMEAVSGHADAFEKLEEKFGRHFRHIDGDRFSLSQQAFEQRRQFFTHRDLEDFGGAIASLFGEGDSPAMEVYIVGQFKARGPQSAAGVKADLPCVAHPFRFFLQFTPDGHEVVVGYLRFLPWIQFTDAETGGWIGVGVAVFDGFAHDQGQKFEFIEGGVVVPLQDAGVAISVFPVSNVIAAMNVGELGGKMDFVFAEISGNIFPGEPDALGAGGFVFVTKGHETGHPEFPPIALAAWSGVQFAAGFFIGHEAGMADGRAIIMAQFGRFLNLNAGGVSVANPPVGRLRAFEQISHTEQCQMVSDGARKKTRNLTPSNGNSRNETRMHALNRNEGSIPFTRSNGLSFSDSNTSELFLIECQKSVRRSSFLRHFLMGRGFDRLPDLLPARALPPLAPPIFFFNFPRALT